MSRLSRFIKRRHVWNESRWNSTVYCNQNLTSLV